MPIRKVRLPNLTNKTGINRTPYSRKALGLPKHPNNFRASIIGGKSRKMSRARFSTSRRNRK